MHIHFECLGTPSVQIVEALESSAAAMALCASWSCCAMPMSRCLQIDRCVALTVLVVERMACRDAMLLLRVTEPRFRSRQRGVFVYAEATRSGLNPRVAVVGARVDSKRSARRKCLSRNGIGLCGFFRSDSIL